MRKRDLITKVMKETKLTAAMYEKTIRTMMDIPDPNYYRYRAIECLKEIDISPLEPKGYLNDAIFFIALAKVKLDEANENKDKEQS